VSLASLNIIRDDLERVENYLLDSYKNIWEEYYKINYRGRLFRASLFLLFLKLFQGKSDIKAIKLAGALEIIHLASLIHDEIVEDDSLYARATPSYKWDNKVSILVADYIFSRVVTFLLEELDRSVFKDIFDSIIIKCEGGVSKVKINSTPETDEEAYFKVIEKGTASLTSVCCVTGVKMACMFQEEFISGAERYGRAAGMAFQIMEDFKYFKIIERHKRNEKILYPEFNISLPFIYTLKKADDKDRKRLFKLFEFTSTEKDREELDYLFNKYGGIEYSIMKARDYMAYGEKEIESIKACEIKDSLLELGDSLVTGKWWEF